MPKTKSKVVVKKNYYPLYRNYYRRIYNNFGTQYFRLKADYNFTIWKENNQTGQSGLGFRFHNGDILTADVASIYLYQLFSSGWGDFGTYRTLFNEFRIEGLRFVCVPNANNQTNSVDYQSNPVFFAFNFVHPISELEATRTSQMLYLNAFQEQKRYWKNIDRRFITTDITSQTASNDSILRGEIRVGPASNSIVQSKSPSWTSRITFYITFRKTKDN